MAENDHEYLTVAEIAARLDKREMSPVEVVERHLKRIEETNPILDSFVTVTAEQAMDAARKAEAEISAGRRKGPLHGVPFAVKDIYETAGVLTTAQSRILIDNVPERDSTAVANLKEAGAILVGKLTTHEFAHGGPSFDLPWPPAKNPWDTSRVTGGSSSGSGAAVAAGQVPAALGSDTGGSIRNPAGLCGLAGLMPTFGLVGRGGVIPNSMSFDHCGPMAWTVEDCAILLQGLAGFDPRDPDSVDRPRVDYRSALGGDVRGLRIGVLRHFWEEDQPANEEMRAALDEALAVLRGLGAVTEDVRVRPMQDYYDVKITIAECELYEYHEPNLIERPLDFGEDFRARALPACLYTALDVVHAHRKWRAIKAETKTLFERFDVLMTAGMYGPAGTFKAHSPVNFYKKPSITTVFNVMGTCAISICCGFSASDMPLSLQFAGKPFHETDILRIADAYEKATPWRERRPETMRPYTEKPRPPAPAVDPASKDWALAAETARRAGLRLGEAEIAQVCEALPHVEAMRRRLMEP